MLKKLPFVALFLAVAASSHASITVTANAVGSLLLSSSGTALASGDIVRIGYFNASLATLETSNSFATLNSDFDPVGEGTDGDTLTENGNATDTLDINDISGNGSFAGQFNGITSSAIPAESLLYMWVFNSSSPSTATQWGIFYNPTNANWVFPADPGGAIVSLSSAATALRGTANGSNFELANIAVVPEPTSIYLLAGGLVIGALALRRRATA